MAEAKIVVRVALEYPDHWTEAERNAERQHRERMATLQAEPSAADVRVDAAYQRGWTAGHCALDIRERQEPLEAVLESSSGPTDYEVWRDALLIAARRCVHERPDSAGDVEDVEYEARKYARVLRTLGKPSAPEPDEDEEGSTDDEMDCDSEVFGTYQVVNPGTGEIILGLTREQYEAHPFKGATYRQPADTRIDG